MKYSSRSTVSSIIFGGLSTRTEKSLMCIFRQSGMGLRRFKSPRQAQRFVTAHAAVQNLFNPGHRRQMDWRRYALIPLKRTTSAPPEKFLPADLTTQPAGVPQYFDPAPKSSCRRGFCRKEANSPAQVNLPIPGRQVGWPARVVNGHACGGKCHVEYKAMRI